MLLPILPIIIVVSLLSQRILDKPSLPLPTTFPVPIEIVPVVPPMTAQAVSVTPTAPVWVWIPDIDLDTQVLPVQLNDQNIVDTPAADVGWYGSSAKPGTLGKMNFNAHVVNGMNQPGKFFRLHELVPGNNIIVTDTQNQQYHYRVSEVELVDVDVFPLDKVYGQSTKAELNLVTCAGVYDNTKKDYAQRTIVYAELSEP